MSLPAAARSVAEITDTTLDGMAVQIVDPHEPHDRLQAALTYTRIAAQPDYGFPEDNDEVQTIGALKFRDYWSVFGSLTYDINNSNLARSGVGLTYDDRDTIFSIVYENTRDTGSTIANDWSIGARLSFRTLGDINVGDTTLDGFDDY